MLESELKQLVAGEALFEQRSDWIRHCWHAQLPLVEVDHYAAASVVESFLTQPIPRLRSHTSGIWREGGGLEGAVGVWRGGLHCALPNSYHLFVPLWLVLN